MPNINKCNFVLEQKKMIPIGNKNKDVLHANYVGKNTYLQTTTNGLLI